MNNRKLTKLIANKIKSVLLPLEFAGTTIQSISLSEYSLNIVLTLPPKKDLDAFKLILPNLQQELNALDAKITNIYGKYITIDFGMRTLDDIHFDLSLLSMSTLKIHLPTTYGHTTLDFADGASCHLLNGGATRMGKTTLWYYLCTSLYLQNPNSVSFLICSSKIEDFYMYQNVPGFTLADTHTEVFSNLGLILNEKESRKNLLRSLGNVKDHNGIRERYPHLYSKFHPIFIVIDEYGTYSDNKPIQDQVTELVERGGSYNIHCILAAQRPDARTVLPARIKANLLARICFSTADENNSIVILDTAGAEKLGRIPGRAIYQDGESNIIQIPKLDDDTNAKIMKPYQKENVTHEPTKTETRPGNPELSNKIQDLFSESTRIDIF